MQAARRHEEVVVESDSGAFEELSEVEITALREALDDEYRAHAIYTQVLANFGDDVLPFANIVDAEARHIDALLGLVPAVTER
jgi:hypothetical protein